MEAPSKIHLTTKAYLAAWARDGELRPVHVEYGRMKPKTPSAVAWRRDWWGSDPKLNSACESACGKLEAVMPTVWADGNQWPLAANDRGLLAQFIALHVVRTPAFVDWLVRTRDESLSAFRDRFSDDDGYARFVEVMRSDRARALRLIGQVNKLGSLIASMHWTVMEFDEPILITGDQPVCPVPLLAPGSEQPFAPIPDGGWLDTIEVRFPLSPHRALIASWYPGPDAFVTGTWSDAINLNTGVRAQADEQWFFCPETEPALPPAILREPTWQFMPLTPDLLSGYGSELALASELRARARVELGRLIEAGDDRTLVIITREPKAA